MKEFFKKYKFYLIPAIYLLLAFLFLKFLIFPFLARLGEKSEEINKKKIDNRIMEKRIEKIPEMKSDWEFFQNKKSALEVILPCHEQVDFIKSVESIAEATGNQINLKVSEQTGDREVRRHVSPADKKEGEKNIEESLEYQSRIPLKITLKGSYSSLVDFVRKIENFQYYVNILSINSKREGADSENKPRSFSADIFAPVEKNSEENVPEQKKEAIVTTLDVVVYIKE